MWGLLSLGWEGDMEGVCISQDGLGYTVVTDSPNISVA